MPYLLMSVSHAMFGMDTLIIDSNDDLSFLVHIGPVKRKRYMTLRVGPLT